MKRLAPIAKRTAERKIARITARPLAFMPDEPNPLLSKAEAATNEEAINNEVTAVRMSISERLKADAKRRRLAADIDYYFVVCFENGAQATAFLQATGYPKSEEMFIDGTILADVLHIGLPKVTERAGRLKDKHDKSLTRLVAGISKRGNVG